MKDTPTAPVAGCGWLRTATWLALALLAGCVHNRPPHPNPFPIQAQEYRRVFRASVWALRDHGFDVARADFRYGTIITRPLGSPTVFEPWYDRNTTASQAIQSTLNEQQRQVTIRLVPTDQTESKTQTPHASTRGPDEFSLSVRVDVERHRLPNRSLTGSARGKRIFGTLTAIPAERRETQTTHSYWEPVMRDQPLEQRLLATIIRRSMTLPPQDPTGPGPETMADP